MGLKEFRDKNGMTQEGLRRTLKEGGYECSVQLISNVERGVCNPPYKLMVAFKELFPDELIDNVFFTKSSIEARKNANRDLDILTKDVIIG